MAIEKVNPSSLYDGSANGMSQATIDIETGLVFVSGQVDWGVDYEVQNHDIEAQTHGAINNLITVLEEAKSSIENILQLRVYVLGDVSDHLEKIVPIIAERIGKSRPALTGVGIASLASPNLLIEIEAVAKVSS